MRDLEAKFERYGRIRDVDVKSDYAFIVIYTQEYYDRRDAEDAVYDMDRRTLDGTRITVEIASERGDSRRAPEGQDKCFNCRGMGHW